MLLARQQDLEVSKKEPILRKERTLLVLPNPLGLDAACHSKLDAWTVEAKGVDRASGLHRLALDRERRGSYIKGRGNIFYYTVNLLI